MAARTSVPLIMIIESPMVSTVGRSVRNSPVASNTCRIKSTRPLASSTKILSVTVRHPSGTYVTSRPPTVNAVHIRNYNSHFYNTEVDRHVTFAMTKEHYGPSTELG